MYKGKRCKSTKHIWLMASVVMILAVAIGGTMAYIATSAGPVENTFTLGQVPITVVEEFNGTTKTDVKIQNIGNVDAYIRAAVVVNWVDSQGNIYGEKPVECTCADKSTCTTHDYQISWTEDGWVECADGYYYYKNIVNPGKGHESDCKCGCMTKVLFTDCKPITTKEGYTLSVEILAQSIQVDTEYKAVFDAWRTDANCLSVNADGTLTVIPKP